MREMKKRIIFALVIGQEAAFSLRKNSKRVKVQHFSTLTSVWQDRFMVGDQFFITPE